MSECGKKSSYKRIERSGKVSLRNVLIVVSDMEKSKQFYRSLFGLEVVSDFGDNVIMTERLVLQAETVWKDAIKAEVRSGNDFELFFEESNFDGFLSRLKDRKDVIVLKDEYVNSWGRRCILLKDPDGHLIEVAG